MISTIRVELLGKLSVWADGVSVLDASSKINKPWQVFCYLVLNRGSALSPSYIINAVWPDEELADPANVLKNAVYMLRREFKGAKDPKESPILYENGSYICNPDIRFEVDAEVFERRVKEGADAVGDEKLRLLTEAVEAYRGELLPRLESEVWVMPLALYYRQLFSDSVKELCEGLYRADRNNELLAVATAANRIDPLEEGYYIYMFRALYAMEMYRAIIPAYNKTARIFSEELGVLPPQEIMDIYADASEEVDVIEQDIMIIKDELREVAGENAPISGPLYCTYDVFKYLYQMVARSSERAGGSVVVLLLTLQQITGGSPPAKALSAAMGQIKTLILGGLLRKSDTVARYSKSQYIIMLSIDKAASADTVINRIRKQTEAFLEAGGMELVYATTELDPIG